MSENNLHAVSAFAFRQERTVFDIKQFNRHCCFTVEAVSQEEAEGLYLRIALKGYPPEQVKEKYL